LGTYIKIFVWCTRYFEEYWEKIRDFTFPSTFVPLSCEAAAALLAAHAQWKSHPDHPKVRRQLGVARALRRNYDGR
jgi:hypothetical protein